METTRRSFLKQSVAAGFTAVALPYLPVASLASKSTDINKKPYVILFQGDSITDGNRGRTNDPNHIMGHGYAFSIASRAGARFPEKGLTFYNRGISGNRVPDLIARWQQDTLALTPAILSILIGVNDTDTAIRLEDTTAIKKFEEGYRALITETKKHLPSCQLVLCEPFIAPVGRVKEDWSSWQREIEMKQEVVRRIAKEYQTLLVPLQKVFNEAATKVSADYWIWDGIHPTVAGHELIAREWLNQVSKELPYLKSLLR